MDIIWIVAFIVLIGLSLEALKRVPLSNPPWLKAVVEGVLLLAFAVMLWDRLGLRLPGVH